MLVSGYRIEYCSLRRARLARAMQDTGFGLAQKEIQRIMVCHMRFFDRFKKGREDERESQVQIAMESKRGLKPGLYEAIVEMSKNDCPATRLVFHRAVLNGTLWYPMLGENPDGTQSLSVIPFPDGSGYAWPVYSEPESMKLDGYELEGRFMISKAHLIFRIAEQNGFGEVHINRGGPAGGAVMEPEIPFLARGRSPYGDMFDTPAAGMEAKKPDRALPKRILDAVIQVAKDEGINALYYLDLTTERDETFPTVFLDCVQNPPDAKTESRISEKLQTAFTGTPFGGKIVTSEEDMQNYFRAGTKIYSKS